MIWSRSLICVLGSLATAPFLAKAAFQPLPLTADGQWILDANNEHVPYVGINWPGALETMVPEGLQYLSIAEIVQRISETGFNSVRLTFAIEMVDQIYENNGEDLTIETAFVNALGQTNGSAVLAQVLHNNPSFTANTKRLDVWDAIATELANRDIYLHLDNHVSKAIWCCSPVDGNSWFGDEYFDIDNWIRGHTYMAAHGKANWPSFSSVGLRNELRKSLLTNIPTLQPYTWSVWVEYMTAAAASIHNVNPDVLIFFGGELSDYDLSVAVSGMDPTNSSFSFTISDLPYYKKFVFEQHQYNTVPFANNGCPQFNSIVDGFNGRVALENVTVHNRAPLVMTEWGLSQEDSDMQYDNNYRVCLLQYMLDLDIGWMLWVLVGSYYIRQGIQDFDETYGILNHNWSGYRGNQSLALLKTNIENTYKSFNLSVPVDLNASTTYGVSSVTIPITISIPTATVPVTYPSTTGATSSTSTAASADVSLTSPSGKVSAPSTTAGTNVTYIAPGGNTSVTYTAPYTRPSGNISMISVPTIPTSLPGATISLPGVSGSPGVSGLPGVSGSPGASGLPGITGSPGVSGSPGMTGVPGMTGSPGATGSFGATTGLSGQATTTSIPRSSASGLQITWNSGLLCLFAAMCWGFV